MESQAQAQHICPWWLGYFLINPVRKYRHDPDKILIPYIRPGMQVLDYGCAMGYFSLPLARLTGENGKVYCIDIQEKMINKLQKRAKKAGLDHIIETRLVGRDVIISDLEGEIDFTLLFAVVHEVPDQKGLFEMMNRLIKPAGRILFAEPKGHVGIANFNNSVSLAQKAGFILEKRLKIKSSHAAVLRKAVNHM